MGLPITLGTSGQDFGGDGDRGKVALYGPDGKLIYKRPTSASRLRVPNARLTAAVAAASLIWACRYNGTAILRVKYGALLASFDGTAAATTSEYQLVRISGANTTGGAAIQPVVADTTHAVPVVDARFTYAAALGVVGVTIAAEFAAEWGCQRQVSANNALPIGTPDSPLYESFLDLRAGEGVAIRLGVVAVIGDGLGGYVALEEYAVAD